jgi:hypothetical protein
MPETTEADDISFGMMPDGSRIAVKVTAGARTAIITVSSEHLPKIATSVLSALTHPEIARHFSPDHRATLVREGPVLRASQFRASVTGFGESVVAEFVLEGGVEVNIALSPPDATKLADALDDAVADAIRRENQTKQ